MFKLLRATVVVIVALTCCGATSAFAATPGSLTFAGCVSNVTSGDLCATHGYGLSGPDGLAISPDGAQVYVEGSNSRAVTTLQRSSSGALSFASCVDASGIAQCTSSTAVADPETAAVSADGKNLYVLDGSGRIDMFARSSSGALTSLGCVGDNNTTPSECPTRAPGTTLSIANVPGAIGVTADGNYVYTATQDAGGANGAVDAFKRAADGTLTALGCIATTGGTDTSCGAESPALGSAGALTISPAGFLFVGGQEAISSFRIQSDGTLSSNGCVGTASGCTSSPEVFGSESSSDALALSPDGTSLYVSARDSNALTQLAVSSGGTLSFSSCIGSTTSSGCGAQIPQICGLNGVAVSNDGLNVYALDTCSRTLMTFTRAQSGALTYQDCAAENGSTYSCGSYESGLDYPQALAVTPDDSQVLVVGSQGNSVAAFARTPYPAPQVAITAPGNGQSYAVGQVVDATYACTPASGGAAISSCTGTVANGSPIDTGSAGTKSFTVTATDVGGMKTTQTVSYTVVALTVSGFRQTHARWSEHRSKRRHAARYGTRFVFTLDEAATVTLRFTTKIHHHTKVVGRLVLAANAGNNRVVFTGRVGGKRLPPGGYHVALSAVATAGGQRAAGKSLAFTIVKPR